MKYSVYSGYIVIVNKARATCSYKCACYYMTPYNIIRQLPTTNMLCTTDVKGENYEMSS